MPTTYAHWAFGQDCLSKMPKNLQEIIEENKDIYNLGVHGPDILFYDLLHPNVTDYGYRMHNTPASVFFKNGKEAFQKHTEKAQMLAYLMGFLSHFALDSTAHSYVEIKNELSPVSHNKIESEWDRHLLILDGRTPNLVDRAETLRPTKQNAKIISYFYPYSNRAIYRSCKWQRWILEKLSSISHTKKDFLQTVFRKTGLSSFADLFFEFDEDDNCLDSNIRLDKLRVVALKTFVKLMKNLLNYLNDKEELDEYFEHDFGPWIDYKEIPVLPYKTELAYKLK